MLATLISNFSNINNEIFNEDQTNDPDGYRHKYLELKRELLNYDITIATPDINTIDESKLNIYLDVPNKLVTNAKAMSVLIINENPIIHKNNWNKSSHDIFDLIFTWNDDYVDNKKYFKFQFSYEFPKKIIKVPFSNKKFLTLISANKKIVHSNELYSERFRAIKWFEKHISNEFDLYGRIWNKLTSSNRLLNFIFTKFLHPFSIFNINRVSYQGELDDKIKTLSKYKYNICYENAKNYSGYITEKIFHCFFSNVVPIYLGAQNIDTFIPRNCYVDKNEFSNYEDLIFFLKSIDELKYEKYLTNIDNFLNSNKSNQFRSSFYSKFIVKKIITSEKFKDIVN